MRWLDQIIADTLRQAQATAMPQPGAGDPFEQASAFRRWPPGLRHSLALRYSRRKAQLLLQYRLAGQLPTKSDVFREKLLALLAPGKQPGAPFWTVLLHSHWFYPLLLALIFALAWTGKLYYERYQLEQVLGNDLLRYSELAHRQLGLRLALENDVDPGMEPQLHAAQAQTAQEAATTAERIRAVLPAAEPMLTALADQQQDARAVSAALGRVNHALDQAGLPYYLAAQSFHAPCWSFLPMSFAERIKRALQQGLQTVPEALCRTSLLLAYRVMGYSVYEHEGRRYPVFHTERLDKVSFDEGALGLTYAEGLGAQVLNEHIAEHIRDSVVAAVEGQRRNLVLPQWLRDRYRLEPTAARALETALAVHSAELAARNAWRDRLERGWTLLRAQFQPASDPQQTVVDSRALALLEQRLGAAIAIHEVQHQINAARGLRLPPWTDQVLKDIDSNEFRRTVIDETSAYLISLAYGEDLRPLLLTQLLSISVNALLRDNPGYYAARIILAAVADARRGDAIRPRQVASYARLARDYRALVQNDDRLNELARTAYKALFGQALPEIRRVAP